MSVTACGDISSRGMTLFLSELLAGPYDEVGAVTVMPDLAPTATTADCTDPYAAGEGGYVKEYKTGEFNGNDTSVTVKAREGDVEHLLLEELFDGTKSDKECYLRVQLADVGATKRTFPALVKGVTHAHPPSGGIVTLQVSLKVNGRIVRS